MSDHAHKTSRLARLKGIQASRATSVRRSCSMRYSILIQIVQNANSPSRTPNNKAGRVRLLKVLDGQAVTATPPATPERPIARPLARQSLPHLPERASPPGARLLPLSAPTVPLKRPSDNLPRGREDDSFEESISAARRTVKIPAESAQSPSNHTVYIPKTEAQLNVSYSQNLNIRPQTTSPKRAKFGGHVHNNPSDYQTATQGTNLKVDVSISVVAPSSTASPSQGDLSLGHINYVEQLRAINDNLGLFHRIRMGFVRKKKLTASDRTRLRGTDSQITILEAQKRRLEDLVAQSQIASTRAAAVQNTVVASAQVTIQQQVVPPEPSSSKSRVLHSPPTPLQARMAHDSMYRVMERVAGSGDVSIQSLGGLMVDAESSSLHDLGPFNEDGDWHGRGKDQFIGPTAQPGE